MTLRQTYMFTQDYRLVFQHKVQTSEGTPVIEMDLGQLCLVDIGWVGGEL